MVAMVQAKLEAVHEALDTASSIDVLSYRVAALIEIARTQYSAGSRNAGDDTLALALETARSMEDGPEKAGTYGLVAGVETIARASVGADEAIAGLEDPKEREFAWRLMKAIQEGKEIDVPGFWLGN
ncbi:MAG: hypothetical protein IH993_07735 [Proteobacteria bacterium]|nr:hypothetical protein [Pseudomonadota bacterium]